MLALFDKNIKHPELLPRYKYLFVEKMQCPLALTPSAEDDQVVRGPDIASPYHQF